MVENILLKRTKKTTKYLRDLMANKEIIVAPGAYDAFSARLIEFMGFDAVYMTGFGTAASILGYPDIGLVTMSEMLDNARRIANSVNIPVIADADTGYGNPLNVIRTVQDYENAGVSGLHIEDQIFPKKCGHTTGKELIPMEEMVEKIRAAKDAKRDPNFLIIARTDAIAVEGFEMALERAKQYYKAGAEMIFVEAPETMEQIESIPKELKNIPLLFNWVGPGAKSPLVDLNTLRKFGYKLVIIPLASLSPAYKAIKEFLFDVKNNGVSNKLAEKMVNFSELIDFMGFPEINQLEKKYVTK
ncbi:MAG: isocitrate lyase/PEP mutase family protein [Caldisphaera sp.]|jgi:2-methylisocitrate lyase-like PEP mutase family enzyme|nr:MAG: carboxyvinyl-carboxyphosphonate phosphorylmutase [Caldisphaera sp.]